MSQTTAKIVHVPVAPLPWERFREVLDVDQAEAFGRTAIRAQRPCQSRGVERHVTAHGGGVAEMLTSLIAYVVDPSRHGVSGVIRRPEPSAEPNLLAWTTRPSATIATAKPGPRSGSRPAPE
jgi:hypothetical protein